MANQTGRPIAPARKLIAAVLGTIAVFVMVFGLGRPSWAIVALGAAMLALSIILGLVNVVRRGARAWVAGQGQVKAISEAPVSSAYGRAELQLTVVAPGLPVTDVLIRDPRVPIGKWPRPGDTLPITVDVDDMRRVRIDWEQATDRADDGDPPPPSFEPTDEYLDDDLLGEPEPPPWATRDRAWGNGPDEPPPPPAPGTADDDDDDLLERPIVVRDTPGGPVLEGQFVDHDDSPPVLPQRARAASAGPAAPIPGQSRPPGRKPSPRPQKAATMAAASGAAAATATVDPDDHPSGTSTSSTNATPPPAPTSASAVPEQRAAGAPGSTSPWTDPPPDPETPPSPNPPANARPSHDPTSYDPAAYDPASYDPAAYDPEPFDSEADDPTPDNSAADDSAPHDSAPHDSAPHDPSPHDSAPHDPSPYDSAPHDPSPYDSAPHDSARYDPDAYDPVIDLPLDGDPEPPPESSPQAREAVDHDLIAPPPGPADQTQSAHSAAAPTDAAAPPTETLSAADTDTEPIAATTITTPNDLPTADPRHPPTPAAPPTITGLDIPAADDPLPAATDPTAPADPLPSPTKQAAPADLTSATTSPTAPADAPPAATDPAAPADAPPAATDPAAPADAPSAATSPVAAANPPAADVGPSAGGIMAGAAVTGAAAAAAASKHAASSDETTDDRTAARGPWADLEGGYEPDDRTDDLITAYPSARPGPAGAIHGVGITVLVTNLARSIAFYRDTLGFFEIDSGTGSAVLASGDTRLVLRTVPGLAAGIGRLISLNLEVGDVEAVYQELKSKKIKFEHGPRPVNRGDKLELWAATFYDPDGHNIAITQWRAAH